MQIKLITDQYLKDHPDHVFVFGDNLQRRGIRGAAALRSYHNSYGFITKKAPSNDNSAFFRVGEYKQVYQNELAKLKTEIEANPNKTYLISRLGAGLANRHMIFEKVIAPSIKDDLKGLNVIFLW